MKNVLLIGAGRFGRHIAMQLSQLGHQVMAVDTNEERISTLDKATLEQIARVSGAEFYRVTPSAAEISLMLSLIYSGEKMRTEQRAVNMYKEQYHIFVITTLLIIFLEIMILPDKRGGKAQR